MEFNGAVILLDNSPFSLITSICLIFSMAFSMFKTMPDPRARVCLTSPEGDSARYESPIVA